MANPRGKLIEVALAKRLIAVQQKTTSETLYNGGIAADTQSFLDTRTADEAIILLDAGTFNGDGTLDVDVVESDAVIPSAATVVTNATFTQIATGANDEQLITASLLTKNTKRYLWLRENKGGTGSIHYGASAILFKMDENPQTQDVTPAFDF